MGLVEAVDTAPGATAVELAERLGLDGFYVSVWCRAALAAGILERVERGFWLSPHLPHLLLDQESPAFAGGLFPLALQSEKFDRFEASLATGSGCGGTTPVRNGSPVWPPPAGRSTRGSFPPGCRRCPD